MTNEQVFSEKEKSQIAENMSDIQQNNENPALTHSAENPVDAVEEATQKEEGNFAIEGEFSQLSLEKILDEMEKIINVEAKISSNKRFVQLKELAQQRMQQEKEVALEDFLEKGGEEQDFVYQHSMQSRFSDICHVQREKIEELQKKIEAEQAQYLQDRKDIIESLKNLYSNAAPDTNFFKEIRAIKERWSQAGQVPKAQYKLLNNDYFYHLMQFYQMLDLNKEYLEQEYAHNLEKRKQIIQRAKELENEPSLQKALNEIQYLHRLWKEEAEPVAEEFREATWEEFSSLSGKIHGRKHELQAKLEAEQLLNLEKKNKIIAEMNEIVSPDKEDSHGYWQKAVERIKALREEFLALGSVPKKDLDQNWTQFREVLREFNARKNGYYKNLKTRQHANLEAKQALLQQAKSNLEGENWDTLLPLYKKLQEDWKKIGHVPKALALSLKEEFQEVCNAFFERYRMANNVVLEDWKGNYQKKNALLEQLKNIVSGEHAQEELREIKSSWEKIGKVPRDKMKINEEFTRIFKKKIKEYGINSPKRTETPNDRARKLRMQIIDLEGQISTLENNINFFNNPSRENPLLKDTFDKIDAKKNQVAECKRELKSILRGEQQ